MAKKKATISTSSSTYANYSKAVEKKLISIKATPGDRIHIVHGQKDLEGILLAQNEMGNPDSIKIVATKVLRQLNERPHKTLAFETPAIRFNACVASTV